MTQPRLIGRSQLDEMEVIGNNLFTVGVPVSSDSEFKAFMMAAGTAYAHGNSSIDSTLRRYCNHWIETFDSKIDSNTRRGALLRSNIRNTASRLCSSISSLNLSESCAGLVASANAQIRLDSTFRAACQLIWRGFPFEAEAVIRLGFEQVAWAYAVRNLDDTDAIMSPTHYHKSITKLKTLLPQAGRFYNELSTFAHVYPSVHKRFLTLTDDGVSVAIRSPALARESVLLLLILLHAFLMVSKDCFPALESLDERTPNDIVAGLIKTFADVLPSDAQARFETWLSPK